MWSILRVLRFLTAELFAYDEKVHKLSLWILDAGGNYLNARTCIANAIYTVIDGVSI